MKDINTGYKLQHLIPAFFIILAGGLLFLIHCVPAILFILTGIALLCMRSGIQIDIPNKRIRKYSALANTKFGAWTSLADCKHVELRYTNESQNLYNQSQYVNIRTRTYDLIFVQTNGTEKEFNDFTDYDLALKVYHAVADNPEITHRNVIAEIVEMAHERRRR